MAEPPGVVVPPGEGLDPPFFADAIIVFGPPGNVLSCVDVLPVCGDAPMPQGGPCAGDAAKIAAHDTVALDVPPLGVLELVFYCSTILEVGGAQLSDDFRIWGTADPTSQPIVEVSVDGTTYSAVNLWPRAGADYAPDPGFQLEVPMLPAARFVRIVETSGAGSLHIDAVEALALVAP